MFIHMFSFRWKPDTTEPQKQHALQEISALQSRIPGILESAIGFNTSSKGHGFEFGGVMKFADRAAHQAYDAHPVHDALLVWLRPLIETAVEVDFDA